MTAIDRIRLMIAAFVAPYVGLGTHARSPAAEEV
jgi:hypothetical protein